MNQEVNYFSKLPFFHIVIIWKLFSCESLEVNNPALPHGAFRKARKGIASHFPPHRIYPNLKWCGILQSPHKLIGSSLKSMGNSVCNMIEIRHQEMKEVDTDHHERHGFISVGIGFDTAMACGVV